MDIFERNIMLAKLSCFALFVDMVLRTLVTEAMRREKESK